MAQDPMKVVDIPGCRNWLGALFALLLYRTIARRPSSCSRYSRGDAVIGYPPKRGFCLVDSRTKVAPLPPGAMRVRAAAFVGSGLLVGGLAILLYSSAHCCEGLSPELKSQSGSTDRTSTSAAHSTADPHVEEREEPRVCTVDDLLPDLGEDSLQFGWVPLKDNQTRNMDCTCPYTKASYFCPHARMDYPSWVPRAVGDGECLPTSSELLASDPFPRGSNILFYGNSHLRQVVEAIMCSCVDMVVRREAVLALHQDMHVGTPSPVPLERQCRGCMRGGWDLLLSENGCIPQENAVQALRCCDERAVFELSNDAVIHYWFAHLEGNKSVQHAFQEFGNSLSDYDVVVANVGNEPPMPAQRVISDAQVLHQAGIPLIWLSTYDGGGAVQDWTDDERRAFDEAGAKYIPVHDMVETLGDFTRGVAEHNDDEHFCLPGPPDELGLLVLQLIRALSHDR